MKTRTSLLIFVFLISLGLDATELKVATLNLRLYFKPGISHSGQLATKEPLSDDAYLRKTHNLASLIKGDYDVVGVEEVGGVDETQDLAQAAGYRWAFTKGRDTYTGEEVAFLYRLPDWKMVSRGRVAALDRLVSKHLLVTFTRGNERISFLVVHLIRPIGGQADKHEAQLEVIGKWVRERISSEPGSTVIVLGDTNDSRRISLYGIGEDSGRLTQYSATHVSGRCFDRLVLAGAGKWTSAEIVRPPYAKKPNSLALQVWTDHYVTSAIASVP